MRGDDKKFIGYTGFDSLASSYILNEEAIKKAGNFIRREKRRQKIARVFNFLFLTVCIIFAISSMPLLIVTLVIYLILRLFILAFFG